MYAGVVNVAQTELPTFLQTAESLHVLGLTDAPRLHKDGKPVKVSVVLHPQLFNNNFPLPPLFLFYFKFIFLRIRERESQQQWHRQQLPLLQTLTQVCTVIRPANVLMKLEFYRFMPFNDSISGDDEDVDAPSGSPPTSPPPAKRSRKSEPDERTVDSSDGHNSVDGQGSEHLDETTDPVSAVLLQQSRSGLTITASQQQHEIDQAYNDDLAEMLEVSLTCNYRITCFPPN